MNEVFGPTRAGNGDEYFGAPEILQVVVLEIFGPNRIGNDEVFGTGYSTEVEVINSGIVVSYQADSNILEYP